MSTTTATKTTAPQPPPPELTLWNVSLMAFAGMCLINVALALVAIDGRALLAEVETEMGRELKGSGLYPAYEKVNRYYESHGGGGMLYWFEPVVLPWSIATLVLGGAVAAVWFARKRRILATVALAISLGTVAVFWTHRSSIGLIAAWME